MAVLPAGHENSFLGHNREYGNGVYPLEDTVPAWAVGAGDAWPLRVLEVRVGVFHCWDGLRAEDIPSVGGNLLGLGVGEVHGAHHS